MAPLSQTLVDYFVYSRDAPGVDERMTALTPAHWSYLDGFADRFVDLLGRSMADRPPALELRESTVVLARWPAVPVDDRLLRAAQGAVAARPDRWVFLGLLVTDDGGGSLGLAAADADAVAAERLLRELLEALRQEQAVVEVHRWERGGRR